MTGPDAARTALPADAVYAATPRVGDDMTVEVALSLMAAARTGHLILCDEDDRCTGLIAHAQLSAVRAGPSYTDRLRLRDLTGADAAFAAPATPEPELAVRYPQAGLVPEADERDDARACRSVPSR